MSATARTTTLAWDWYVSPDILRREQELIFRSAWHYAGPLEWLSEPGDRFPCLAGTLGPLPELIDAGSLVFRERVEFELSANWKVAVENYLECYHCPVAHKAFSALVDVDPDAYRLEASDGLLSQYGRRRAEGDG